MAIRLTGINGKFLYKNKKFAKIAIKTSIPLTEGDYTTILNAVDSKVEGTLYGVSKFYRDDEVVVPNGTNAQDCSPSQVWLSLDGAKAVLLKGVFDNSLEKLKTLFNPIKTWNGKTVQAIDRKTSNESVKASI